MYINIYVQYIITYNYNIIILYNKSILHTSREYLVNS